MITANGSTADDQPRGTGILSRTNAVGQNVISRYGYTLNALGQRTAMINSGSVFPQPSHVAYQYNEKGEVIAGNRFEGLDPANPGAAIAADSHFYRYDDIGNRKLAGRGAEADPLESRSYTSNLLNQYTEISLSALNSQPSTLIHDPDGNLTDDDRWHYTWNGENRLIAMQTQPAAVLLGAPNQRLEFAYDYQGRRVQKKVLMAEASTGNWSLVTDLGFAYDGWNLVAENSAANSPSTVHRTYTWGLDLSNTLQSAGGVGGLLAESEHSTLNPQLSTHSFPTYDANGNVVQCLDSSGAIAAQFEYSPFGETIRATGSFALNATFRFSTKYSDAETGLLYYNFRYYSPSTGRWLTRDPIEENGGLNLYGIVGNAPTIFVDFLGLDRLYFVARQFMDKGGLESFKNFGLGHGYLLVTDDSDNPLRSYSWHPSEWPTSPDPQATGLDSIEQQIAAGYDGNNARQGRVWESDPVDLQPPSAGSNKILISCDTDRVRKLELYVKEWIRENRVGYEIGRRERVAGGDNDISASPLRLDPGIGATQYWVYGQNCFWWATTMLNDTGFQIPVEQIGAYNFGVGVDRRFYDNRRAQGALRNKLRRMDLAARWNRFARSLLGQGDDFSGIYLDSAAQSIMMPQGHSEDRKPVCCKKQP